MGVASRMKSIIFRSLWSSIRMSTHWPRPQTIEDKIPSVIEMDRKKGTLSCILAPEVSESSLVDGVHREPTVKRVARALTWVTPQTLLTIEPKFPSQ